MGQDRYQDTAAIYIVNGSFAKIYYVCGKAVDCGTGVESDTSLMTPLESTWKKTERVTHIGQI